jgi:RsiW-degrading membrane proteinase PrsW (M82 family)
MQTPHDTTTRPVPAEPWPPPSPLSALAGPWSPPGPPHFGPRRRLLPPWLLVLGTGLVLYLIDYAALLVTRNIMYVPSLIAIGAITVPAAFLVYVSRAARASEVPPWGLMMCALWGGVLGTVMAGVIELDTFRALGTLPALFIGLTEESVKLAVPLLVLATMRRYRHLEINGLVIGVAVGMGFAVFETMGYGFAALLASRGNIAAVDHLLLLRGLLAPAGHIAWTGLATAALWRAGIRRTPRAVVGFFATFLLVVTLHALWDGFAAWWTYLLIAIVGLSLLRLRIHRCQATPFTRR